MMPVRLSTAWRRRPAGAPSAGAAPLPDAPAPHIIVADDDILIGVALRAVLQSAGYRVSLAHDGLEALETEAADRADAVLTDLHMPRMNGPALVHALHARRPQLPVIVLTSAVQDDGLRTLAHRVAAVLTKPAVAADILDAVARAVESVRARESSAQSSARRSAACAPLRSSR